MRALLVALAFTTATPLTYVVRLDSGSAPVLAGARVGTLTQATRTFGKPDRVLPLTGTHPVCRALWGRLGLEIRFSAASRCSTPGSWLQVTMRAARWHTSLGLRAGDREARLHALYPDARRLDFLGLGTLWELETGGPLCDGGPPLALAGRTADGRVNALLVVHVPACG
ncbi:MAG: hypothetical protein HOQ28_12030 [Thermoleophilia bacterium]|nr:hypothetical protein [Thermoleophilia bacterium]